MSETSEKVAKSEDVSKGPRHGGGSRKGCPNKLTKSAKEAFQFAFEKIGGAEYLAIWAKENPTEFMKLFARLIPTDVNLEGRIDYTDSRSELKHRLTKALSGEAIPSPSDN